ncbi:NtaA/DmoA family FMN-dependent monooxygenase [Pseudonocardia pini]|uniref:NtaA/DmoA family FMN-dependent monooxygenase n=1 Tax=Pseudonocardia pini TaxID=2758030 RepID=UPI0015F115C0|nr:NtaA/DmoA family FMN-dependent monooxygenase [Pseudonocardia pini]
MNEHDTILMLCYMSLGGGHLAAWRDPAAPENPGLNLPALVRSAQKAEEAALHGMFIADSLALWERTPEAHARTATNSHFEPMTLCAALSQATERLGFVITGNTTYNTPYGLARSYASLDHLSGGRVAWNVVTSGNPAEAGNFGGSPVGPSDRYQRAAEFVEVARGLWDGWDDDALVLDRATGVYHRADALHALDHEGKHFAVRGPLTSARPPQGHPVIAQAGSSPAGRDFAATYGDLVLSMQPSADLARTFYREVKALAAAKGRDPEHVKVLSNTALVLGRTQDEADERLALLDSLVDPVPGLESLSLLLVHDMSGYPLDEPVPDIPLTETGSSGIQQHFLAMVRSQGLTLRQAMQLSARAGAQAFSVESFADHVEEYVTTGAADGFNLVFADLGPSLDVLAEHAVPELRRRGLFRSRYRGTTLRDDIGIPRPAPARSAAAV